MDIRYKVTLHSAWHCGSGDSKGADLDALVIKDKYGLPYIPGKTMKGLIRNGFDEINQALGGQIDPQISRGIFGLEGGVDDTKHVCGECFFTNANLQEPLYGELVRQPLLATHLYKKVASTAIDAESGVAVDHSLRTMEVTIPLELEGEIINVNERNFSFLKDAMAMVKRLGVGRNRGLGRCTLELIGTKGGEL